MASYTFSRTGAEIEGILDHAANQWTVIEGATLTAEEWRHEKTDLSLSEVVVVISGFAPGTNGENVKLIVNGIECVQVWHNAPQVNSYYHIRALPLSQGCYIEATGGSSQWKNFSPLYTGIVSDATDSRITSVKIMPTSSSFPVGCTITMIGRA